MNELVREYNLFLVGDCLGKQEEKQNFSLLLGFSWLSLPMCPIPICLTLKISALLRYNLHIIKFASVKYTLQWFFIYSQGCATVTTNSRTLLSPQKEIPYTLAVTSHFPTPPRSRQPLLYFLTMDLLILGILYKGNQALCGLS